MLIYENLYALNTISGGSLYHTLMHSRCRVMYAAMIRENYKVQRDMYYRDMYCD